MRQRQSAFGSGGEIQEPPKALHVVVHLDKLIVQRGVGDRGQMKNRVELFVAELLPPIERREILRDEITAIAGEILEIARAEIVDHRQTRFGNCSCKASTRFDPMNPAPPVTSRLSDESGEGMNDARHRRD